MTGPSTTWVTEHFVPLRNEHLTIEISEGVVQDVIGVLVQLSTDGRESRVVYAIQDDEKGEIVAFDSVENPKVRGRFGPRRVRAEAQPFVPSPPTIPVQERDQSPTE